MTGRIYFIGQKNTFSSGLEKQELGITRTDGCAYPNVMLEVLGPNVSKIATLNLGSPVKVTFEIQGKVYVTKEGTQRNFTVLKVNDLESLPGTDNKTKEATATATTDTNN